MYDSDLSCHCFGDDVHHLVVTAAATRGAMRCILDILKNIKQRFELSVRMNGIKNVKIGDVVAKADRVILLCLGIDRGERTNDLFHDLAHPKTVQIAVSVNGKGSFVGKSKGDRRDIADRQTLSLTAAIGLEVDPKDRMLLGHRVRYRTDRNGDGVALDRNDGKMLLLACFDCVWDELRHFLTAAHHRNARIVHHTDQITAMLTNIKLIIAHKKTSKKNFDTLL